MAIVASPLFLRDTELAVLQGQLVDPRHAELRQIVREPQALPLIRARNLTDYPNVERVKELTLLEVW